MASANKKIADTTKKTLKTFEKPEEPSVAFINIKQGYLPGEQILVTYSVNDGYTLNPNDSIVLQKCGSKSVAKIHIYRWPVSTKPHGNTHRTRLSLPNPNRRLRSNEYQFAYLSSELDNVIGRSKVFKVSDIVELDRDEGEITPGIDGSLDVANAVDRGLFDEPITRPRPVKIYDVNWNSQAKVAAAIQVNNAGMSIEKELQEVLNARVSSENMLRVAELIKQYERVYSVQSNTPKTAPQTTPQMAPQTPPQTPPQMPPQDVSVNERQQQLVMRPNREVSTRRQSKVAELLALMEKEHRPRVAKKQVTSGNNDMFLDTFVLPFINGVLEYLKNDGYSRIICKNNQTVLLENSRGKTLDLRNKWSPVTGQEEKRQLPEPSLAATVAELTDKYTELVEELDSVKHDSEVRILHYVAEMRKSQTKEVRKLNHKIHRLQRELKGMRLDRADRGQNAKEDSAVNEDDYRETLESQLENLHDVNTILAAHIKELEQELTDKTAEYAMLYQILDSPTVPNTEQTTSTEILEKANYDTQTKTVEDESKKEMVNQSTCVNCKPRVQKATSYAAASTTEHTAKVSAANDRKQMASSERGLAAPLTNDQQNWLNVIKNLVAPEQTASPLNSEKNVDTGLVTESESTESLAEAMKRLFSIYSSPSLASTNTSQHSLSRSESAIEAIRLLFGCDSSSSTERKPSSYPATPCNSADSVPKSPKPEHNTAKQSSSLKDVLKWLFRVSDEKLKKALPGASAESISSLGQAMRDLFKEESYTSVEDKPGLSTSNESLAEAMHRLFDRISQQSLAAGSGVTDSKSSTSSLGSTILWGLADHTPEEFQNVNVRKTNLDKEKERKHRYSEHRYSNADCECHKSEERKNPSLSSVLRSSSPDNDVNISFPSVGRHPTPTRLPLLFPQSQENSREEQAAQSIFTVGTDVFAHDPHTSRTAELSAVIRSVKKCRRSRQRRVRRFRKRACPHCAATFYPSSAAQTMFRISRHLGSAHREEDDSTL